MTAPPLVPIRHHMVRPIRPNSGQRPDTIMQHAQDFREPRNESQPCHARNYAAQSIITLNKLLIRDKGSQTSFNGRVSPALCHKTPEHSSTVASTRTEHLMKLSNNSQIGKRNQDPQLERKRTLNNPQKTQDVGFCEHCGPP